MKPSKSKFRICLTESMTIDHYNWFIGRIVGDTILWCIDGRELAFYMTSIGIQQPAFWWPNRKVKLPACVDIIHRGSGRKLIAENDEHSKHVPQKL